MSIIYPGQGAHLTQVALFKQIWIMSDERSFVSGLHLRDFYGKDIFLNCFAHVLPKGQNKYPHFKYFAGNIVLLTPGEHALWDQGTEEARISYSLDVKTADWAKLERLRDDLIIAYKKYFPTTMHGIIGYKYTPEEVFGVVGKLNKEYWKQ